MSKKQTTSEHAHTLSTRLTTEQKELIERAAEAGDMTTAKFLRDAALKHASDLLNAMPNDAAIRHLAGQVFKLLTSVTGTSYAECIHDGHDPYTNPFNSATGTITLDQVTEFDYDRQHFEKPKKMKIELLDRKDRQDLLAVMSASPRAFADALRAEFTKPSEERPRFKPIDLRLTPSDD